MVAIVTDALKADISRKIFDEVVSSADSVEFYIGIGKTDIYDSSDTTATPLRNTFDDRITRGNLESIKKVAATSFVVPRNTWSSGTIYDSWNDKQVGYGSNAYYVLTEDNEVYICLQQSKDATTGAANPSTVKPSFTDAGVNQVQAFQTSDGYRWKLLYSVSAGNATNFLTAGFIPVERILIDSSSASAFQLQQLNIQNTPTPGQIIGVDVVDGGSGYTSAPTLTFRGNGSGALATATVVGGQIVKVEMDNESAGLGSGFDFASVAQSGGGSSNATLRPNIGPREGFGKDPRNDLKSSSIMLNTKPTGAESGAFNITNDFRQISLLKELKLTDSALPGGTFGGTSTQVNRRLTLTANITTTGFLQMKSLLVEHQVLLRLLMRLILEMVSFIFFHQNEKNKKMEHLLMARP